MLDDDAVTDAARRLLAAERSRQPIRQLSLQYPDMTVEDAYRVQRALVAAKIAEGRTVRARKIGLTSRAMQQAVSITEPDYGVIFDDWAGPAARAGDRACPRSTVGCCGSSRRAGIAAGTRLRQAGGGP